MRAIRTDAGGKGINVAKVLHSFGVGVTALGLAAGHQGRQIRHMLNEQGIRSSWTEATGETRINLKIVDEATRQTTELNEPGFRVDTQTLKEFTARFLNVATEAALIVLGGSLPPGVPPDYYRLLIEEARKLGCRVILDADGEALAHGVRAAPYAIKPNIHELEALLNETFESEEAIVRSVHKLMRVGIEYVLVSMGGNGSLLVSKNSAIRAKPFPITPVSTVGAGDSMVAAMAYCLLLCHTDEQMARWTSAAGTMTAAKPGTQVCTLEEVRDSIQSVPITYMHTNR